MKLYSAKVTWKHWLIHNSLHLWWQQHQRPFMDLPLWQLQQFTASVWHQRWLEYFHLFMQSDHWSMRESINARLYVHCYGILHTAVAISPAEHMVWWISVSVSTWLTPPIAVFSAVHAKSPSMISLSVHAIYGYCAFGSPCIQWSTLLDQCAECIEPCACLLSACQHIPSRVEHVCTVFWDRIHCSVCLAGMCQACSGSHHNVWHSPSTSVWFT